MLSSNPMHANGRRLSSPRAQRPRHAHPARPAWVALAASALPLLLACGGGDSAKAASNTGDDTSGGDGASALPAEALPAEALPAETLPAQPPNGVYAGTYVVPIEAELEAYAHFDVSAVRFDVEGAALGLRYELPELLLGQARRIAFRGTADAAGVYRLEGDAGTASCQEGAGSWVCDEVLRSLEIDTDKLDRLLSGLPETEARARRSVADRFIDDPIGVLHVQMP